MRYNLSANKIFYFLYLTQIASIVFSIALAQILYAIIFVLWLFLSREHKVFEFTLFDILFFIFVMLRIVTIFLSEFPSSSSIVFTREIIFYPYYFIASYFVRTFKLEGIQQAIQVLVYSSVIASLYAISSVLTGSMNRGASFSGGYYSFSVHLTFVIAFSLGLLITEKNIIQKNIFIASVVIIVAGIVSTYTRSMWVAVLLCVMVLGITGYRKLVMVTVAVCSALVLLLPAFRIRFTSLISPLEHSSGRVELWNIGVNHLSTHPFFGYGPETFKNIVVDRSMLFDTGVASWHNELLQVQIESGIFTTLLLVVLYSFLIYFSVKLFRQQKSNSKDFMLYFLIFSLCVIIPAIITGSLMFAILNGMLLKFIFACSSYFGNEKQLLKVYKLNFR